ncbi:MAG: hypothetical protein ACR2JQ_02670, partial [Mycobacteriales bacterium]
REDNDAIHGSALLATELLRLGSPAALAPASSLRARAGTHYELLVASHMTAWDDVFAHELLRRVDLGAVLVIDGTSGHKDPDAALHRPWPGVLADRLGFRSTGLRTNSGGYPVSSFGAPVGRFPLVVAEHEFSDPAWSAIDHLRMPDHEAAPCVWTRSFGEGKIYLVAGPLGPAMVHDPQSRYLARQILSDASPLDVRLRPLSEKTTALAVRGENLDAVGVFAPPVHARRGQPLRIGVPSGEYFDVWSGTVVQPDGGGECVLRAPDGIALLTGSGLAPTTAD